MGDVRWPEHLRPGAVRFARESAQYVETVAFYRDLVGLPVVGSFVQSHGEDGTIFGLPGAAVQLEIVRAHGPVVASEADQLVLYFDDDASVTDATARLHAAGHAPAHDIPAYWAANDAVLYRDPDGRAVLFAPWVYGRDVEPTERRSPPDHVAQQDPRADDCGLATPPRRSTPGPAAPWAAPTVRDHR